MSRHLADLRLAASFMEGRSRRSIAASLRELSEAADRAAEDNEHESTSERLTALSKTLARDAVAVMGEASKPA